jgi:GNAT superfamily N-acetyltransferase
VKQPAPSHGSWVRRLWGRLRHGLLIQEALDRLQAGGIICMPYYVTVEAAPLLPELGVPPGYHMRPLGTADAPAICAISVRERTLESILQLLEAMRCYGIFHGEALAGYTWARFTSVPVPGGGVFLFELTGDEAYLIDMFIAPAHRGARLAPWLRAQVIRALHAEGRTTCYSISLAFNRSSRLFKSRLGAQERELRVYLQLCFGRLRGIDVRLSRNGPHLRTPTRMVTPSAREITARG